MKAAFPFALIGALIFSNPAAAQTAPAWAFQSYKTTLPLSTAAITVVTLNYPCSGGAVVPVVVPLNQPLANYADDAAVLAAAIPIITSAQQSAAQAACAGATP